MRIENTNGWIIEVVGEDLTKIDRDIVEQLEEYDGDIFWNDSTCTHWMFDFKINNVWFENAEIDYTNNTIKLYVY